MTNARCALQSEEKHDFKNIVGGGGGVLEDMDPCESHSSRVWNRVKFHFRC